MLLRRIQTLDTTQGIINQIVGGVKLQIKTPSDGIDLDPVASTKWSFSIQYLVLYTFKTWAMNEKRNNMVTMIEAIKQNIVLIIIFLVFNIRDFDFTNIYAYIFPGI
jgi:uncharacterized membrane protein YdbT with pleckstrin-like domain